MAPLSIVPASTQPSRIAQPGKATTGAPSISSVHDSMRHGLPSNASKLNNAHPLEARLKNWEANQEELKMEGLRRNFGMCEVIRREMEMKFARAGYRPTLLGGPSNLHLDILRGKDTTIDWDDVFQGDNFDPPSFHDEMEARLSMKW